jgi:hypothetical protein
MIEVHKDRHPNLPYTYYKIVGDNGEPDSTGTYYVKQSYITVWDNGRVEVTGKFTNAKLQAILAEIVADLRGDSGH